VEQEENMNGAGMQGEGNERQWIGEGEYRAQLQIGEM
jgi:hypothetical protein